MFWPHTHLWNYPHHQNNEHIRHHKEIPHDLFESITRTRLCISCLHITCWTHRVQLYMVFVEHIECSYHWFFFNPCLLLPIALLILNHWLIASLWIAIFCLIACLIIYLQLFHWMPDIVSFTLSGDIYYSVNILEFGSGISLGITSEITCNPLR